MVAGGFSRSAGRTLGAAALAILASAAPGAAGPASASPPRAPVAQGIGAGLLARASPLGATAPTASVRVAVVLRLRHAAQLAHTVEGGGFRAGGFLSVARFAGRYGQPPAVVSAVDRFLRANGLTTHVYPDRLDITATGTAADVGRTFAVALRDYRLPARASPSGGTAPAQTVHGTTQTPTLPRALAAHVLAVLGLTGYHGAFTSQAQRAPGESAPGHAASTSGPPPGMITPAGFLDAYGGTALQHRGHGGAGQTVGIVTLASLPVDDPYAFWRALGLNVPADRIRLADVDGGAGPVSLAAGSDETALDVEQPGAIAPRAHIVVYQAPNSDLGLADAFYAAVSENAAGSLSTSWGSSETFLKAAMLLGQESTAYPEALNQAFLEAAAQGQSVFTGAGDWAAYTASADLGSTNLSVGNPDDSPDVTTVGGTTLAASRAPQVYRLPDGSRFTLVVPQERIWGWDYLWPAFRQFGALKGIGGLGEVQWAKLAIGGSGGGISRLFGMPAYQARFPGIRSYAALRYLSSVAPSRVLPAFPDPLPFALPTDWAVDLAPTVVTARVSGSHRLEPDFAVDADPRTGFAVYMAQFATAFGSPWQQYGGTSFGGPQMNGVAALVNGLAGRRSGFWNPALYRAAAGAGSPFRPLTAQGSIAQTTVTSTAGGTVFTVPGNDNLRFTGLPGARYGMGGGLGVPDLGRLARALTR